MTVLPDEVDPFISERILEIRNRFGIDGLRVATGVIEVELAIFADAPQGLLDESS